VPGSIRPNRPDVSDRFPVAGFTIRTGGGPSYFEVAVATNPGLFLPDNRGHRTESNFFSTRGAGPLLAERGEAVYLLPTAVLSRFAGNGRLYYSMATFSDRNYSDLDVLRLPPEAAPSIAISGSFTGKSRAAGVVNPRGGLTGNGYHTSPDSLEWAGDTLSAGTSAPVLMAPGKNGKTMPAPPMPAPPMPAPPMPAPPLKAAPAQQVAAAHAASLAYDDGFGPWDASLDADNDAGADADDGGGIEGPIPDSVTSVAPQGLSRPFTAAEYPQASRFVAAASSNFRATAGPRTISRMVIHITDGGKNIDGPVTWFQNPKQPCYCDPKKGNCPDPPKLCPVSAHYVVGQDGEVVQMVLHKDVAWHAGSANGDSIGIEHVANTRGLLPSEAEYKASAALVVWLCNQFGLPADRTHILGHAEADPKTGHKACPNGAWDWDHYMSLVSSAATPPPTSSGGATDTAPSGGGDVAPAASQSLGYQAWETKRQRDVAGNRKMSAGTKPLGIVIPDDVPANLGDALSSLAQWLRSLTAWAVGVPDTTFFPFSAICQLRMTDGSNNYTGTGFYIGTNTILTCAHNLYGMTSATVIPGKNDRVSPVEPFGHFNVDASSWTIHPSYDPTTQAEPDVHDFDLAVIRVATPPPTGQYFSTLEELNQSRPSPIIVCGYAARSVDRDRQHMDSDMVRQVTDNRMLYNLQTEPGNSGSPVFYFWAYEDEQKQMTVQDIRLVGVHVSSYSNKLNQACRLTEDKIKWIRSASGAPAAAQSLGRANAPNGKTNGKNGLKTAMSPAHHRKPAHMLAYNIIQPTYTPANADEAKVFMKQWAARRERWRAGVQDTTIFPHSAICRFRIAMPDGEYIGTGSYIDRDLVLTCAHNCVSTRADGSLVSASSITIIPGFNDLANPPEPYGHFSVTPTAWTVHPSYNPAASGCRAAHDFDLAVIRVGTPPPNGQYFKALEELLQSQSSPIMLCGYAAESVSADRQHMDGDHITGVADNRFDYDIQTEGGSSGSPVFYLAGWEDENAQASQTEIRLIGVHTHLGANPDCTVSDSVNGGCRLTAEKIKWINSFRAAAAAQSLGYRKPVRKNGVPRSQAYGTVLALATFPEAAVQQMQADFVRAQSVQTDCVQVLNSGLRQLFGAALANADGTPKALGTTVQDSMAALARYGMAQDAHEFEFADAAGMLTKGVARPEHLQDSAEDWLVNQADSGHDHGWYAFVLSLLDGYHNVVLALDFSGRGDAGTKLFWLDQIHGGFDEVTGTLDARITRHTQEWWDPLDASHKPKTRVSVWPLSPAAH
jgi:V8-like Glu-specific endopeptidase